MLEWRLLEHATGCLRVKVCPGCKCCRIELEGRHLPIADGMGDGGTASQASGCAGTGVPHKHGSSPEWCLQGVERQAAASRAAVPPLQGCLQAGDMGAASRTGQVSWLRWDRVGLGWRVASGAVTSCACAMHAMFTATNQSPVFLEMMCLMQPPPTSGLPLSRQPVACVLFAWQPSMQPAQSFPGPAGCRTNTTTQAACCHFGAEHHCTQQ